MYRRNMRLEAAERCFCRRNMHPDAKLAPPREERDEKWRSLSIFDDALTTLKITGGEILEANCHSLDCRIGLGISASFADCARFRKNSTLCRNQQRNRNPPRSR